MTGAESGPWQGRIDSEDGALGHRWHQVIRSDASEAGIALLGLASDLGVRLNKGRPGAAEGPAALRKALANMAWHHDCALVDTGDVTVEDDLAAGQSEYARALAGQLERGHFAIGLGGGHEIGWASYQGCRSYLDQHRSRSRLGIINFDAHFDLRLPSPEASSGTPFYQVAKDCEARGLPFDYCCVGIAPTANTAALFQRAESLDALYLLDSDCRGKRAQKLLERFLAPLDALYVTVCLDVFAPAAAPGVSAPAAPGIDPHWVMRQFATIGALCRERGVQWLMADIAELSPPLDIDARTARLGGRLIDALIASRRLA